MSHAGDETRRLHGRQVGASAAARLPAANASIAASTARRRGQPAVTALNTGAAKVAPSAYSVTALPACPTPTCSPGRWRALPIGTNSARPSANALSAKR